MATENKIEALARTAYQAYDADRGGLNYLGKPNPKWVDLPPEIRHAWRAAVASVVKEDAKEIAAHLREGAKEIGQNMVDLFSGLADEFDAMRAAVDKMVDAK
jgi:hypothetical protein